MGLFKPFTYNRRVECGTACGRRIWFHTQNTETKDPGLSAMLAKSLNCSNPANEEATCLHMPWIWPRIEPYRVNSKPALRQICHAQQQTRYGASMVRER